MTMSQMLKQSMTRRRALLVAPFSFAAVVSIASGNDSEPEVTIVEFNDAGEKTGTARVKKVLHTEAEWRKLLTLQQFYVTRKEASDLPFSGTYFKLHDPGLFRCLGCGNAVFSSDAKFDSKSGFPCFSAPIAEENIRTRVDADEQPKRTGVLCRRCDAHLGYLYNDGPEPSHLRYCSNESALRFVPRPKPASGA
jgi:peptide-methionine (R)-S-oxide reductase